MWQYKFRPTYVDENGFESKAQYHYQYQYQYHNTQRENGKESHGINT